MSKDFPKLSSDLLEIFRKRLTTKIKNKEKLYQIFSLNFPELMGAMLYSNSISRKLNNNIISYSLNVFLPLTPYCRNNCRYCNFRKEYNEGVSAFLLPEQIKSILKKSETRHCTEALLTMGEKPEEKYSQVKKFLNELGGYETTIEYLLDICKLILENSNLLPHCNAGIVSYDELKELKEVNASLGLMLENISPRLMEHGEAHEFSPGKDPKLRIETIRNAGKLKIPFTTGILLGIGEKNEEIIDSILEIEKINEKYGNIQEIIIQGYSDSINKYNNKNKVYKTPSITKIIKTIIITRLITDISIQIPPNLFPTYEIFLLTGIDDWGGISPLTPDYINPGFPWPKISNLKTRTEELGYKLKQRLPIYPEFIFKKYFSDNLKDKIFNLIDENGYVK
ncbi:MAG: 7,8-didemethyl-8-hydroxy-5-deazariboflavin synthase subunit CofG [Candidatus Helarchaeota archaeon]